MNNELTKLRKCINCGIGTDDLFPRDAHEEDYCYICIMRGKAIQYKPEKVYLVYYNGWDEYHPDLLSIHTTKDKAEAEIIKELANHPSISGTVDDFNITEMEIDLTK